MTKIIINTGAKPHILIHPHIVTLAVSLSTMIGCHDHPHSWLLLEPLDSDECKTTRNVTERNAKFWLVSDQDNDWIITNKVDIERKNF